MQHDIKEGDVFKVKYPFCAEMIEEYEVLDDFNCQVVDTFKVWHPGTKITLTAPEGAERNEANGDGVMILRVVSVHKPGKFPTRVFYTREFIDPEGNSLTSKNALRVCSIGKFRRISKEYYYEYFLVEFEDAA